MPVPGPISSIGTRGSASGANGGFGVRMDAATRAPGASPCNHVEATPRNCPRPDSAGAQTVPTSSVATSGDTSGDDAIE
ncbi:hypothetical protein D3C81_1179400 [compost metagenome]